MVEESQLWRRAFAAERSNAAVSKLVTSLRGSRTRAGQLTSRIAANLPELTIHDISHLDALWDVASTIVGPDFRLNPLEAYIFGSTVLLHDAGLCFEAYAGGRDAVRRTVQWQDVHRRLARTSVPPADLEGEADFEALRTLHASQAGRLATEPWQKQQNEDLYLIDDGDLRENYGRLIGDLASSHHWNLEEVVRRFSTPRPPAVFLDEDWSVDSLKIACMLRVADAGHIDAARAPSFLLKTLQMNSVSRAHWLAQNRLGRLAVTAGDSSQLTISSTSPFPRSEAGAWWVAFDLVARFDKELRDCNDILDNSGGQRSSFPRKRVAGAGQPRELVKYVETIDWEPTESTVHVSDVSTLVGTLGGEELYGRDVDRLEVVLRELVQNAADAVYARRAITPDGFVGGITVRLRRGGSTGWILEVDDAGVGMSQATLSNDLLDFGRSFWASERAAREFPGIHASGYSSIGRFGIGFFSVFMAARNVTVFSRRFDKGLEDVRCLSFENGISLRPILSADRPSDLGMGTCTRVSLEVKPGVIRDPGRIEIRCSLQGYQNFHVPFDAYVAAIVSGVNVSVVVEAAGVRREVQERFPPQREEREQWLQSVSYVAAGVNHRALGNLARALPRLREIRDGQRVYGLAAVDVAPTHGGMFLSGKAVGGFVPAHGCRDDAFVGVIEHVPAGVKREAGDIAAPRECVDAWLSEQVTLLQAEGVSDTERLFAAHSLCQLGWDPASIFPGLLVWVAGTLTYWSRGSIGPRLEGGARLGFAVLGEMGTLDMYTGRQLEVPGARQASPLWVETADLPGICAAIRLGRFNEARLSDGVPADRHSLIGVVHRVLAEAGYSPRWTLTEGAYSSFLGRGDMLEVAV